MFISFSFDGGATWIDDYPTAIEKLRDKYRPDLAQGHPVPIKGKNNQYNFDSKLFFDLAAKFKGTIIQLKIARQNLYIRKIRGIVFGSGKEGYVKATIDLASLRIPFDASFDKTSVDHARPVLTAYAHFLSEAARFKPIENRMIKLLSGDAYAYTRDELERWVGNWGDYKRDRQHHGMKIGGDDFEKWINPKSGKSGKDPANGDDLDQDPLIQAIDHSNATNPEPGTSTEKALGRKK